MLEQFDIFLGYLKLTFKILNLKKVNICILISMIKADPEKQCYVSITARNAPLLNKKKALIVIMQRCHLVLCWLISGWAIVVDETGMLTFLVTINLVSPIGRFFKQTGLGPPLCPSNFLVRKLDHRLHNSLFITALLKGRTEVAEWFSFPLSVHGLWVKKREAEWKWNAFQEVPKHKELDLPFVLLLWISVGGG